MLLHLSYPGCVCGCVRKAVACGKCVAATAVWQGTTTERNITANNALLDLKVQLMPDHATVALQVMYLQQVMHRQHILIKHSSFK